MHRDLIARKKNSLLGRYSTDLGQLISRDRAEKALRAAAIESALASKAKSAFLATMSHELRTPLNAIIGFSDLLQNGGKAPVSLEQTAEYAAHISHAGHNLLKVVSDVLDISRIESGALVLDRSFADIGDVVQDAAAEVASRMAQKKQKLEIKITSGLPHIEFDYKRVRQILANLLSNANKFTHDEGRILILATSDNDREIKIAVADNGVGMTPEQIEHALKPFSQVDSKYSRQQEGAGLGLTITKALVAMHGGRLFLSSTPDVGTIAAFTLPKDSLAATNNSQSNPFLFGRDS